MPLLVVSVGHPFAGGVSTEKLADLRNAVAGLCLRQDTQNMGNWKPPGHRGFLSDLTIAVCRYG